MVLEITGRVIDQHTGSGVEGLRVEIWDIDRALLGVRGKGVRSCINASKRSPPLALAGTEKGVRV